LPLSYLIIFLTGAGTLALELLSSRVLTPLFGVSLYIWSSILSINPDVPRRRLLRRRPVGAPGR